MQYFDSSANKCRCVIRFILSYIFPEFFLLILGSSSLLYLPIQKPIGWAVNHTEISAL